MKKESVIQAVIRYTKASIPIHIKNDLLTRFNIDSLSNIKGRHLADVTNEINGFLQILYAENKNIYARYFNPVGKTNLFFSQKSIFRYFKGDPIRLDKLYALLAFLGYEHFLFESIAARKNTDAEENILSHFVGCWYVYVHDSSEASKSKVIRTPLFLKRKNKDILFAEYESVRGIRFFGDAEITGNSLILKMSNGKDLRIYIIAEVPEKGGKRLSDEWILNGALLSNAPTRKTIIANIIFSKNYKAKINSTDNDEIKKYLDKKAVNLIYNNDYTLKGEMANENEKLIIDYLSRNKDKGIKTFLPNSFDHLKWRNTEYYRRTARDNYDRLKLKLKNSKHIFYAFNRYRASRNEVGIFSYTFDFNDPEKICSVMRHPINNPAKVDFTGIASLENEKLYLDMRDTNMQRKKQLIAPFNPDGDKYVNIEKENFDNFLFKGITSSVSTIDSKCMALRELILCISSNDEHMLNLTEADKTNGYISYEKFCAIDVQLLTNEEKLFLANQALSTLSYPSDTNARFTHARQDKARKYQGIYEVYTPIQHGPHLLKMILLIDSLSQITLKIKYDNKENSETYTYHGICEFYNHNLHVGAHLDAAHPTEQKHSEFIFDYIKDTNRRPLKYFKGTHLTTDDEGNAYASKFIACKIDKDETTKPGTTTITSLVEKENLFKKLLGIHHTEQYFNSY